MTRLQNRCFVGIQLNPGVSGTGNTEFISHFLLAVPSFLPCLPQSLDRHVRNHLPTSHLTTHMLVKLA